jgi:hypothetical protein
MRCRPVRSEKRTSCTAFGGRRARAISTRTLTLREGRPTVGGAGVPHLLHEGGVALAHQPVEGHERLERDDPVGAVEALAQLVDHKVHLLAGRVRAARNLEGCARAAACLEGGARRRVGRLPTCGWGALRAAGWGLGDCSSIALGHPALCDASPHTCRLGRRQVQGWRRRSPSPTPQLAPNGPPPTHCGRASPWAPPPQPVWPW